ncbi:MAG: AraC family transcriptional regulator [Firmicutes bacterium]|nr:AraC family transcriptional regulator [Bacillota bacterium]
MAYLDFFIGADDPVRIHAWQLLHDVTTGPHTLSCYLLIYVTENQSLHIWDRNTNVIRAGDMMLIHPGQCHRYSMPQNIRIYNCLFEPEMTSFAAPDKLPSGIAHIPFEKQKIVERLLLLISERNTAQGSALSCDTVKKYLDELLFIYSGNIGSNDAEKKSSGFNYVLKAMNLIQQNRNISISSLAGELGLNPDYLNRIFKKELFMTIMDYKIMRRAVDACDMLENTGKSVEEIARELGYKNVSLFCSQFKTVCKKTPAEYRSYRKNNAQNDL